MNRFASKVSGRLPSEARVSSRLHALVALAWMQWRKLNGDVVIPPGGTSPLGMLGHVNAALELADQIAGGILPEPSVIVVPLGTGGTAVGLSIGLALAGLHTRVVGVRVVPRIVARRRHLRRLRARTISLIEQLAGDIVRQPVMDVTIDHSAYGGAYGRPLPRAESGKAKLNERGLRVDDTYSAKAFTVAVEHAHTEDTLFWLTFDSRWIQGKE
jgi:D-cysteine desulfhydrase